jgi:hypothetical protein
VATNYIDEFLVRLGSSVDASGMQRFNQALREAQNVATNSATSMAGSFFKAQTEIVGGFLAIGSAAVGLVDKVAMSDQTFRLFALHMYMSKTAARDLKVAMDALDQPLENLTWDPELRARTQQLIADQKAMAPEGGGQDFEAQMKKIRDIRFEFTRMEVEGQYLAMHAVNDFLTALGMGPDTLLQKLERFNDYVIHHMPEISTFLVTKFMPVWRDIEHITLDVWHGVEQATIAFANFVGVLSGDNSIVGSTMNLDHFATALEHVSHGFATVVEEMLKGETQLLHLATAAELMSKGKWKEGWEEVKAAQLFVHGKEADDLNAKRYNPITSIFGAMNNSINGSAAPDSAAGALNSSVLNGLNKLGLNVAPAQTTGLSRFFAPMSSNPTESNGKVSSFIDQYVTPMWRSLVHAVSHVESGERQYDSNGNLVTSSTGAVGAMQLTRATAAALGVDRTDTAQNVKGGATLLDQLLKKYAKYGSNDVPYAIAAYHEGEPKMAQILAKKATLSPEGQSEVAAVLRTMGQHGDVQIGTITVHIDKPGATNADVGKAVVDKIRESQNKRIQRNLYEGSDEAWGY